MYKVEYDNVQSQHEEVIFLEINEETVILFLEIIQYYAN